VAKGAQRKVIQVLAIDEGTPSSERHELWLGVLLEQLQQVRAGIDMRE
jgi:hypothetical protein